MYLDYYYCYSHVEIVEIILIVVIICAIIVRNVRDNVNTFEVLITWDIYIDTYNSCKIQARTLMCIYRMSGYVNLSDMD